MGRAISTAIFAALVILGHLVSLCADTLDATLGGPVVEVSHGVDIHLKSGVATYKVRRSFANHGTRHDEAVLRIDLPYGAAATGLRIRARDTWYDGELMEREEAGKLYKELTGIGPHAPRDPALLQWLWSDRLLLQMFPVLPGGVSTVEYTLTVPTRYTNGRHVVSYPKAPSEEGFTTPVIRVFPEDVGSRITIDGELAAHGQPVVLREPEAGVTCGSTVYNTGASCAVSAIELFEQVEASSAEVTVDVRHTYKSDLMAVVVAPDGSRHVVHDREGGEDNHIQETVTVELEGGAAVRGTWRLEVSDHAGLDVGTIESWSVTAGKGRDEIRQASADTPVFVPDAVGSGVAGFVSIEVTPPPIDTVSARLGRVVGGEGKEFLRLEIDAAPELRPLPEKLQVVFLVDASHSMGEEGIRAQLDVARAFLAHVPDAWFEVVLYRRYASRVVGGFAAAPTFGAIVTGAKARGDLKPGNGSHLDRGYRTAVEALGERRGTKYIVSFTDDLLRPAWENRLAVREIERTGRRTVVHLVIPVVEPGVRAEMRRNDEHALAPIPEARGGILAGVAGVPSDNLKALERAVLGLVRPTRIDHFEIAGADHGFGAEVPEVLEEGAGFRGMARLEQAPIKVVLKGKIWSRPFKRAVPVKPKFTRQTAAFVFSHDLHDELTEKQMLKVAMFGRAVSPVTSYLAIEPGVRPSTEGLTEETRIAHGAGGGTGSGHGFGGGRLRARKPPDFPALMREGIERCVAAHSPAQGWSAALTAHTTYDEVVDVILESPPNPFRECLVEAAWAVRLTDAFDLERDRFDVTLP
jgi:subtilisin-like proprotein convertase family protein